MLLSEHCRKFEDRIKVLEAEHKNKGQFSVEMENKYKDIQN